ncbi:hypothetical protein BpHYR1_017973 [Brachionus plicatilis]|uniref:Uncharacterized protein n=1 Tax=Brachionus plicatilis TaxID=10195 RepID=A0A3M7R7U6_BRAPC|nr:hypothetical protein BpHYR1_017973 [Brachionus plicatilis]
MLHKILDNYVTCLTPKNSIYSGFNKNVTQKKPRPNNGQYGRPSRPVCGSEPADLSDLANKNLKKIMNFNSIQFFNIICYQIILEKSLANPLVYFIGHKITLVELNEIIIFSKI